MVQLKDDATRLIYLADVSLIMRPEQLLNARSAQKAVFIGETAFGRTVMVGDDTKEEVLFSDNMSPVSLDRMR